MCILRLSSKTTSFKSILKETDLPCFSVFDAGEYRDKKQTRICKENLATLNISDKEWDDAEGQMIDAVSFLTKYKSEIKLLNKKITDLEAGLDFPINSKLDGNIVTHGIIFPNKLAYLSGELEVDIGLTLYQYGLFE